MKRKRGVSSRLCVRSVSLSTLAFLLFTPLPVLSENYPGSQLLYAQYTSLTDDTLVKDLTTGRMIPLRELRQEDRKQKLDSVLYQLVQTFAKDGIDEAKAFAAKNWIIIRNHLVDVTIELDKEPESGSLQEKYTLVNRQISAAGGNIKGFFQEYIRAYVPIEVLEKVARLPQIKFITAPGPPLPQE